MLLAVVLLLLPSSCLDGEEARLRLGLRSNRCWQHPSHLLGSVSSSLQGGHHLLSLFPGLSGRVRPRIRVCGRLEALSPPGTGRPRGSAPAPGPGWEKRGQKGVTEARQQEERDRNKKVANANLRIRKDVVGGVSTPGHDSHSRHLDQNITEIEKRKCC